MEMAAAVVYQNASYQNKKLKRLVKKNLEIEKSLADDGREVGLRIQCNLGCCDESKLTACGWRLSRLGIGRLDERSSDNVCLKRSNNEPGRSSKAVKITNPAQDKSLHHFVSQVTKGNAANATCEQR